VNDQRAGEGIAQWLDKSQQLSLVQSFYGSSVERKCERQGFDCSRTTSGASSAKTVDGSFFVLTNRNATRIKGAGEPSSCTRRFHNPPMAVALLVVP
jgi:hypothetical protein